MDGLVRPSRISRVKRGRWFTCVSCEVESPSKQTRLLYGQKMPSRPDTRPTPCILILVISKAQDKECSFMEVES